MTDTEIKALAKQLRWENYDYFGPVEQRKFGFPKHLILKRNTILAGDISITTIDTNGFTLFVTGTIDFDRTVVISNHTLGK